MNMFSEIPVTQDELDKIEARRQAGERKNGLINLKTSTVTAFVEFWYSKILAPDQHLAVLGTGASSLFTDSRLLQETIYHLDPTWVFLVPPYEYEIHADGHVTLGAKLDPDPNAGNPLLPQTQKLHENN